MLTSIGSKVGVNYENTNIMGKFQKNILFTFLTLLWILFDSLPPRFISPTII